MSGFLPEAVRSAWRILVVDDDEANLYAKSRLLRQAGFSILEAASGEDALRRVTRDTPDLVMLDVRLPDIDGMEVCRRIRANPTTSPLPILQTSASYRDDSHKVAGLECGADAYITEPVEPAVLVATVNALLRMRRAELALREHAVEWQATFDAITDGVALIDSTGRIVRFNSALAGLLGRPPGELAGAAIEDVLPPEFASTGIWQNLPNGERQRAEIPAGARIWSLTVDPVCDSGGQFRGAVSILSDITERKAMNERLQHKQKLESIGLLAGGVAHDFNNILTGILGNASLGLERLGDPRSCERAFRDVVRAAECAADLTRQLLAYAGKGKVIVEHLDLSDTIRDVLPLVRASIPHKVQVALKLQNRLPAVSADKTQIEQILMNLLINAAEAIGEIPGKITVRTEEVYFSEDRRRHYLSEGEIRGRYVKIEVTDTGCGMDAKTANQIFDPFFTTKFMGRGLGLSAVLGILRAHSGAIRVISIPGTGSTFELLFPAAGPPKEAEARPAAETGLRGSPEAASILVVDDEAIVRSFFQAALERQGYDVVLASNGAEGLRIFSEQACRFGLVLLDLVMPVMNGKELLPKLLELRPDVRVIVTSGQAEEEVLRELGEWEIAGFIQKPCASPTLVEKIRACGHAHPRPA